MIQSLGSTKILQNSLSSGCSRFRAAFGNAHLKNEVPIDYLRAGVIISLVPEPFPLANCFSSKQTNVVSDVSVQLYYFPKIQWRNFKILS